MTFTVTASQPWRVSTSPDTSSVSLSNDSWVSLITQIRGGKVTRLLHVVIFPHVCAVYSVCDVNLTF